MKTGEELLGQQPTQHITEIYKKALRRVAVRTVDGKPCWCLVTREEALDANHRHDYRCKIARNLV